MGGSNYWVNRTLTRCEGSRRLSQAFGFTGDRDFMITLGLASIVIVVDSAIFKTITLHLINRFMHLLRHSISALDAQTEQSLNDAIGQLSGEKAMVIVAHKEPSLQRCDTVVSIEGSSHKKGDRFASWYTLNLAARFGPARVLGSQNARTRTSQRPPIRTCRRFF